MRSRRTSIGIILTLSLLVVPTSAAGQSSDVSPEVANEAVVPVHVTWTGVAVDMFRVPGGPVQAEGGSLEYTGTHAVQRSDDPRISGDHITVMLGDASVPPGADDFGRFTTLVRIENDLGAWQGPVTDVFLPHDQWIQYGWLKGEGAYDGLSFFTSGSFKASSAFHKGEGVIWPGDPPPVPDAALLDDALDG